MNNYWTCTGLGLALSISATPAPAAMGENLIYVPVAPCRIVNTRTSVAGSLYPDAGRNFLAWGTAGELAGQGGQVDCLHPKQAEGLQPVAIAANFTAVGKRASGGGNIVAYPAGGTDPGASLVNFTTAANIANAGIVKLCTPGECPADGDFALEANIAIVPAIVDVQGYFYPKEMHNTVTVSATGGDFSDPLAALAALAELVAADDPDKPSAENPYLVKLGPGIYELGNERLELMAGVTLQGAGRAVTTLRGNGSTRADQGVVNGADDAGVRDLSIESVGASTGYAIALYNGAASPNVERVDMNATGATNCYGVLNDGADAKPMFNDVAISATGNAGNTGVRNQNGAAPILTAVSIVTSGGIPPEWSMANFNGSSTTLYHGDVAGDLYTDDSSAIWFAFGVLDGAAEGEGFTCAGVVDGGFNPLTAECLPVGL